MRHQQGKGRVELEQLLPDSGALLALCNPKLYSQPFLFPRNMTKRGNISFQNRWDGDIPA